MARFDPVTGVRLDPEPEQPTKKPELKPEQKPEQRPETRPEQGHQPRK